MRGTPEEGTACPFCGGLLTPVSDGQGTHVCLNCPPTIRTRRELAERLAKERGWEYDDVSRYFWTDGDPVEPEAFSDALLDKMADLEKAKDAGMQRACEIAERFKLTRFSITDEIHNNALSALVARLRAEMGGE